MFEKLGLRGRLIVLVGVALAGLVCLAGAQVIHLRGQMLEDRKATLHAAVDMAMSVVKDMQAREQKGELSREEAQQRAKEVLRSMRYLGNEYFYVYDSKGMGVMHATQPDYEGVNHWERKDKSGQYIVRQLVGAATGSGYVETFSRRPGSDVQVPKLQHLAYSQPWDWAVGTGLYLDDLDAMFRNELLKVGIGILVMFLLVGASAWAITRAILRQIGGEPLVAMRLMERASEGDLTAEVGKVPPGSLLASLDKMLIGLRGMVTGVGSNARTLVGNAGHIAEAADQVALAARTQSDATSAMAAAVEQMTVSINHISQSAQDTEDSSATAAENASTGERTVSKAADEIGKIADSVTAAATAIRQLEARAGEISTVTGVIRDIAAQTNLLALNAAIEAARAGEQGRGFAVVADEVRGLAERTAAATLQIGDMVGTIQGETGVAVAAMDAVLPQVEQGVGLAREAASSLRAIRDGASATLNRIRDVALATREQSAASTAIAQQVESIAQMVEETSAAMASTADSAKSAEQVADDLNGLVARFRY
ncbi:methyl-accepting chemotaxis protein [Azoarcus indigens]|nr:methyl-accepting chemotaxis protein [Azoarcus indigens]